MSWVPEWLKRLRRTHPGAVAGAVVVAAVALVVALVWPVTDLIAAHDVGLVTSTKGAAALQAAREAVRTQLLTLGAGVFAAGALIFTGQNFLLSRKTVELTRQTFELTEQGQVTDRYARAIEQLGSASHGVRVGAIYALERIARDSARDSPTVMAVLAAYIREQAADSTSWRAPVVAPGSGDQADDARLPGPDLAAALAVLGRREHSPDDSLPDLVNVDLSRAYLPSAQLAWTDLKVAIVAHADLTGADLTGADLFGADLAWAMLSGAKLCGANLIAADLTHADLTDADLSGAHLGAFLFAAKLTDADLGGAIVDPGAPLPAGWHRNQDSGRAEGN